VLVQVGLLVVGTLYTIFACFQWCEIRKQATIAKQALTISQRPWINVGGFSQPDVRVGAEPFAEPLEYRNYGTGPAWLSTLHIRFHLVTPGQERCPESDDPEAFLNSIPVAGIIIGPGEVARIGDRVQFEGGAGSITEVMFKSMKEGTKILSCYGLLTYRDALDLEHRTGFGWVYHWGPMMFWTPARQPYRFYE
jgi:hypothetical protein